MDENLKPQESTQQETRALCSVSNCPQPATTSEKAESEHWRVVIHYCDEHAREINEGTPLGPVGLEGGRLEVRSRGIEEPLVPSTGQAIGPG
ncbi:MAG: hypothetical protein GEU75_05105 [Dehalococcoidia bacterium]|nr:hypothetical protein [Dehalococcoidia bacterium]